jgi:hypothetical protein
MSESESGRQLPAGVRQFLETHVDSFEQLEVLLLLHAAPDQEFTAGDVSKRLSIAADLAETTLSALQRSGLVAVRRGNGRLYKFSARPAELGSVVDDLARTYQRDATPVVRLIAERAMDRVRTSAARLFADAFRLGAARTPTKDKKDG